MGTGFGIPFVDDIVDAVVGVADDAASLLLTPFRLNHQPPLLVTTERGTGDSGSNGSTQDSKADQTQEVKTGDKTTNTETHENTEGRNEVHGNDNASFVVTPEVHTTQDFKTDSQSQSAVVDVTQIDVSQDSSSSQELQVQGSTVYVAPSLTVSGDTHLASSQSSKQEESNTVALVAIGLCAVAVLFAAKRSPTSTSNRVAMSTGKRKRWSK
jgi:hypothetical protein